MARLTRPFSSFGRSTRTLTTCFSSNSNEWPSPTGIDFASVATTLKPMSVLSHLHFLGQIDESLVDADVLGRGQHDHDRDADRFLGGAERQEETSEKASHGIT